jgi:hypothetical protein
MPDLLKPTGKPGRKRVFLALGLSLYVAGAISAGGRQDKELIKYLENFESLLYIGKNVAELRANPDITGLAADARAISAAPRMDFVHTDIYGNAYRLRINYRIADNRVDAARVYCPTGDNDDITALYYDACLFLEYYGAYNEYLSAAGQYVFNGNRHGARIQLGNKGIYLTLDDKERRYFPSKESIRIKN